MTETYQPGYFYVSENSVETTTSEENFFGLDGDTIRITKNRTIADANDSGKQGELCIGSELGITYLYYCKADDTWVRCPMSSWLI